MATVYLARDLRHGRMVALKLLRPELAHVLGPDRFQREIKIAAGLSHPHILPLYESGSVDAGSGPRFYYSMPYVEGESLRSRLLRERQLPLEDALKITRELAGALGYAHEHGVVHRDLKPENVLLSGYPPRPGTAAEWHVLLADFGIAKALSETAGERLTETGLALGTPAYMSPEQASGDKHLDHRSDLYALGCILYEMLAGQPPFTGPTAQSILARHSVDPVPRLRTVRPIPAAVELAVERALAKVPADRFSTAAAFRDALHAPGPSWLLRARMLGFRQAKIAMGIVAVAAVAVGAVLLRGTGTPAVVPAATTIAVLPFRSSAGDTALTRLGRDLATTVSASLDGVGGIRTADRLSVASLTRGGETDSPEGAVSLARRLGAGSVLRGTVVGEGEKVRLDVALYTTEGLAPVAQGIVVTGHRDSIAALTDSVVWSLLRQVWQHGKPPSPSLSAVTTRSLPALRAFLDGERFMGNGDLVAASLAYGSAIAADSTLLMAYLRYAVARSMLESDVEPEVIDVLHRQAHTLPDRERVLAQGFLTDTLDIAVEKFREVTRRFPSYWPGWFLLGDQLIHEAPMAGYDWTEGLDALHRAVELNPRFVYGWEHIFKYANGRRQALADSALTRLHDLGWPGTREPFVRLQHGLARSGGIISPELDALTDSVVGQHLAAPEQFGDRYGSLASVFLAGCNSLVCLRFPAAQIEINTRRLKAGPTANQLGFEVASAWAWAARGAWDSATVKMARLAQVNPGTYVPRRRAQFGDPVLAVESYAMAVLGAWLGATPPETASERRSAAVAAIARLPDDTGRSVAKARLASFDGLLGLARGDREAIKVARRDAANSGYRQAAMVERSIAAFDRALGGDRAGAGRALAALEHACMAQRECDHYTPEMAVNRLVAAGWLQEAGGLEEAARLLRWQDAATTDHRGTLQIVGRVLAGPTWLTRARLEEARGDRRRAEEYYRQFLQEYDAPIASQAHLVEEARAALAGLTRE
jgi:serine/threonine-protein kinase